MKDRIKAFIAFVRCNLVTLTGAVLTTISFITIVTMITYERIQGPFYPVVDFILYTFLPMVFVFGLVLIPAGILLARRRAKKKGDKCIEQLLTRKKLSKIFPVVTVLTLVNIALVAFVSYEGYHYMDSTRFCGLMCHTVMEPEYTRYLKSPHARVECVNCHIGEGASWFVKSKISGARQLIAVMTESYETPIPTPIHDLRPSRETCEQCHWPEKFHADKLMVNPRYLLDRGNTKTYNVYVLRIGSGGEGGKPHGIHWHVSRDVEVLYRSEEDLRENIYWIEVRYKQTGEVTRYVKKSTPSHMYDNGDEPRLMDCVDCHNRPTHIYDEPRKALDRELDLGTIDAEIPWINQVALNALTQEFTGIKEKEEMIRKIGESVYRFYRESEPDVLTRYSQTLEQSVRTIQTIFDENIYPRMKITWNTYQNHLGHGEKTGGCLRCHDNLHVTDDGTPIRFECELCHYIIAKQAHSPRVLDLLKNNE